MNSSRPGRSFDNECESGGSHLARGVHIYCWRVGARRRGLRSGKSEGSGGIRIRCSVFLLESCGKADDRDECCFAGRRDDDLNDYRRSTLRDDDGGSRE